MKCLFFKSDCFNLALPAEKVEKVGDACEEDFSGEIFPLFESKSSGKYIITFEREGTLWGVYADEIVGIGDTERALDLPEKVISSSNRTALDGAVISGGELYFLLKL